MFTNAIEDHVSGRTAQLADLLNRSAKFRDDDIRTAQEIRLSRAIEMLDKMKAKSVLIRTNQHLSEMGMLEQLRQLAKDQLAAFAPLFKEAEVADETFVRANAQILAVPAAAEGRSELATLLREQELRGWIRGLPLASVLFVYIRAVEDNDIELIRAIRTSPGPALLTPDFVERVTKEHTQEERLTRLESLDILRKELRDISQMLKTWLLGYEEPKFPTPPIKQAPASMAAR